MKLALAALLSALLWGLMLAAGLVAFTAWHPAAAQTPVKCYPAADVIAQLSDRHGEVEIWSGRDSGTGNELVLFASTSGTWTVLIRQREMLCGAFSGDSWQIGDSEPVGDPA